MVNNQLKKNNWRKRFIVCGNLRSCRIQKFAVTRFFKIITRINYNLIYYTIDNLYSKFCKKWLNNLRENELRSRAYVLLFETKR